MRWSSRPIAVAVAALTVGLLVPGSAGAASTPGVTATATTDLRDGQTVGLTATGFLAVSARPGTFVPRAFQCRGLTAPAASEIFLTPETLALIQGVLDSSCVSLGDFPVTGTSTTARDIVVHLDFTTPSGASMRCDAPGCSILVAGLTSGELVGMVTVPITFAPPCPKGFRPGHGYGDSHHCHVFRGGRPG